MTREPALERILEQEIEAPASHRTLFDRLGRELPGQGALLEFLDLKIEHNQRNFYVRSEHAWFRSFGWRLVRPFLAVAALASVGFALQRAVDPALGVALFLAGAATLYVIIHVLALRRARQARTKLADSEAAYRSRLEEQLARLRRDGSNPV